MSINSLLLRMLLSSDTPILLISEKMLEEDDSELEKALLDEPKPQTQIVPYVS